MGQLIILVYMITSFAVCVLVHFAIYPLALKLVDIFYWLQKCFSKTIIHKQVIYQNMKAHVRENNQIGFTFVCVVAFLLQVMTVAKGFNIIFETSVQRIIGADLTVVLLDSAAAQSGDLSSSSQKGADSSPINQIALTELLRKFK